MTSELFETVREKSVFEFEFVFRKQETGYGEMI